MDYLKLEWRDMLDKLTRLTNRINARERMRRHREQERDELDGDDLEEPAVAPGPVAEPAPPVMPDIMPYNPFDKRSIRAHLRLKNGT